MISVVVLGTGNVGTHLIDAFLKTENINLVQVYGRNKSLLKNFEDILSTTSNFKDLKEADVYIIAVSDNAISQLSSKLDLKNKLVVHTSGSMPMGTLKNSGNKGVFYPLQTFSKQNDIDFNTIPICIETELKDDLIMLEKLASSISDHVFIIDSEQRKHLHIAAVFVNNFVNHLYKIGFDICEENNVPSETLYPLIIETAQKIISNNPSTIQTGPAYRNDTKTIQAHLDLLTGEKKKIYKLITESIKNTHGKKL